MDPARKSIVTHCRSSALILAALSLSNTEIQELETDGIVGGYPVRPIVAPISAPTGRHRSSARIAAVVGEHRATMD
jgi:hypothetical protein